MIMGKTLDSLVKKFLIRYNQHNPDVEMKDISKKKIIFTLNVYNKQT